MYSDQVNWRNARIPTFHAVILVVSFVRQMGMGTENLRDLSGTSCPNNLFEIPQN
jgi:hypothetical protein